MHQVRVGVAGLIFSALVFAQGSGSTNPTPAPAAGDLPFPEQPFRVTRTATGNLASVGEGHVVVEEPKAKEPRRIRVDAKVRVTAHKKSELGGRKKLTLGDLRAGMAVRVVYEPETNRAVEVRVLEKAANGKSS